MISSSSQSSIDPRRSFYIRATRIKAELDSSKEFFWFYVSVHLGQLPGATISLSDLDLVEYHLLDSSIPNPNVRVTSSTNGFEYRLWLYGFIRISADLITKDGQLLQLPPVEISWDATPAEKQLNGENELSW